MARFEIRGMVLQILRLICNREVTSVEILVFTDSGTNPCIGRRLGSNLRRPPMSQESHTPSKSESRESCVYGASIIG